MPAENTQKKTDWHSVLAPVVFLIVFVLFVYGGLLIALLGASAWYIDAYDLTFFAALETAGIWLLALGCLVIWIAGAFILASIPYYILRFRRRYIAAENVRLYMFIILTGIFIVPFILWRNFRNNHPGLRRKYRQKLKHMAKSQKMQERLSERQLRHL